MSEIKVGLYFPEKRELVECAIEKKISFKENMKMLNKLLLMDKEYAIYDMEGECFIPSDKTPEELGLSGYHLFYLFKC